MTNEELVRYIRNGHPQMMEQLWEQNQAFIYMKAREAMWTIPPTRGVTADDLVQSGYLALSSAVETYDEAKGSLLTWLGYYLKSEFSRAAGNNQDPLLASTSLDAPLSTDDESGTLLDTIPDSEQNGTAYEEVEDRIYREQLHSALDNAIDKLPSAQANAIRGRYWENKSRSSLAEEYGVPESRIRSAEQAGLRRLRSPAHSASLTQFLDDHTDYYRCGGLRSFNATGKSSVENIVLRREELSRKWERDLRHNYPSQRS